VKGKYHIFALSGTSPSRRQGPFRLQLVYLSLPLTAPSHPFFIYFLQSKSPSLSQLQFACYSSRRLRRTGLTGRMSINETMSWYPFRPLKLSLSLRLWAVETTQPFYSLLIFFPFLISLHRMKVTARMIRAIQRSSYSLPSFLCHLAEFEFRLSTFESAITKGLRLARPSLSFISPFIQIM
jgi:hypothetical protein